MHISGQNEYCFHHNEEEWKYNVLHNYLVLVFYC